MNIEYLEIMRGRDGHWFIWNWTDVMMSDLHSYFDSELIEMRRKFVRVQRYEKTYYIYGLRGGKHAYEFVVWYHDNKPSIERYKLNE